MRIRFLINLPGSILGGDAPFDAGEAYEVRDDYADSFVAQGVAVPAADEPVPEAVEAAHDADA